MLKIKCQVNKITRIWPYDAYLYIINKYIEMKRLIKELLLNLLAGIPQRYKNEIFRTLGRSLSVRSFVCEGDLGLFEGSLNDYTVHNLYLLNKCYSPGLQTILNKLFVSNQGTFIDVGANIGLTVIPIAIEKTGVTCFAFEPELDNYRYLRKNIIANDIESKIKIFNLALFSEDCVLNMELSQSNMGDHRVRLKSINETDGNLYEENSRETVVINARKLDNVIEGYELKKPIIMKIDVQGSEVRVFGGANKVLPKVDFLITEFWPYGINRLNDSVDSFIQVIKQFSFGAVYNDNKKGLPKLSPIGDIIKKLTEIPSDGSSIEHYDVIFSRHPEL